MMPSIGCPRHRRGSIPSPSLFLPWTGDDPLVRAKLTAAEQTKEILAVVDSGAPRSLFPKTVAEQLRIADQLVPCTTGEGAGGEEFDLWEAPVMLTARIIREPEGEPPELWGPEVPLDAAFSEKGSFLLGVRDFFAAFEIEFIRGGDRPRFYLSY